MSFKDFHPCLPGEGRYARPRRRFSSPFVDLMPSRRWIRFVAASTLKDEAEYARHLLPAHQRKKTGSYRH